MRGEKENRSGENEKQRNPPLDEFMEVVCRNCSERPEGKQTCTNTSITLCILAELWREFRKLNQRGGSYA